MPDDEPIECWILAPSSQEGPWAEPMFPHEGHKRPEFRGVKGQPNPVRSEGHVDLPGDQVPDSPDMIAMERETAQRFFHRMGLSLRVARGEAPIKGRFSNGLQDPAAIARALHTHQGFAIPLADIEAPLALFVRWIRPDAHRSSLRASDLALGRQILSLLRESRHSGGHTLLFIPQTVEEPTVKPFG